MFNSKTLSFILLLFTSSFGNVIFQHEKFIEDINSKQKEWTAGLNFEKNLTIEEIKGMTGALSDPKELKSKRRIAPNLAAITIPESFDAREHWKDCKWIKNIRQQRPCGSCWAFAATAVMSDRICIHSKGKIQVLLSPQELLDCCYECHRDNPCNGGYANLAWQYWIKKGIVTGGDFIPPPYGCKPYYPFSFLVKKDKGLLPKPNEFCTQTCKNGTTIHSSYKYYGKSLYIIQNNPRAIQAEIMMNGPVHVTIEVYDDFFAYQKGVYSHVFGKKAGAHSMKVLGWGVENGIPYWLCANSWGQFWGKSDGFIKIRRGVNMVGIENVARAGMPKDPQN